MTPTPQPKALELAASAHLGYRVGWQREAAAELRRQHAEIDSLRAEVERLRADAEMLRQAGTMMSNVCFNAKQLNSVPEDWREHFRQAQQRWDDAAREAKG